MTSVTETGSTIRAHGLRIVEELTGWVGHSPQKLQAMRDGLESLRQQGAARIED